MVDEYLTVLEAGEAECLAVAVIRQARFFSDDLAARRLAQAKQIPLSGTIGLLLSLIRHKTLTVKIPCGMAVILLSRTVRMDSVAGGWGDSSNPASLFPSDGVTVCKAAAK